MLGSIVKFFKGKEGRKTQAHPSLSFFILWFPLTISSLRGYQTPHRAWTVIHPLKPLIAWHNFRLYSYLNTAPQLFVGPVLLGKRRTPAHSSSSGEPATAERGGEGRSHMCYCAFAFYWEKMIYTAYPPTPQITERFFALNQGRLEPAKPWKNPNQKSRSLQSLDFNAFLCPKQ